ncbi:MAG: sporulation protein YqfD [Clostridia bacterium]
MNLTNSIKNILGVVTVQIEGFFTERFINLCKINNIKIWEVRNVVKGVIRFKINISEFKKLKKVAKKTKCKIKIKEKKGIYFKLFKYRKRKFAAILLFFALIFCILFSTVIWNINISGNDTITSEELLNQLKESGLYVGKTKIGLDKKKIINNLRLTSKDVSWVGLEINGTQANIKVVEKTRLEKRDIQQIKPGDIIATKSGIITKIVPENGTAKYKVGSYIEEGTIVIEGTIYSKFIEPIQVPAKGIFRIDCDYTFEKEYKYEQVQKEYTGKKFFTIGIGINYKENMFNYLNKSKKYDISKISKKMNFFGKVISFDFYKCVEYVQKSHVGTKEELLNKANLESEEYFKKEILAKLNEPKLVKQNENILEKEDGIIVKKVYTLNEEVGKFVERNY